MPYRRNNYDFVIDSSFTPFTMQEMLVPFMAYKDAFEKSEEAYTDLTTKADKFKYLAKNLDPNSEAAKIYNGYANDLKAQAEDLANNGLSMGNRSALTNLKRRYQGEIGRLVDADTELKKERELRRQMSAKDPSMLWAADNLTIDNFLDGNTPSLYGISGNELYAKGAAAGKAASARIYSDPKVRALDKYYNEYFSTVGYSPEKMQEFREKLSAIPELQRAAMDIVKANKVGELGEDSANYQAALQQIVNGIADGAIYQRQSSMQRNWDVMTAAERDNSARSWASFNESKRQHNNQMKLHGFDEDGNYHPEYLGTLGKTKSGNPVYLDKKGNPFAYGKDGVTKYYDNDGDGVFKDTYPSKKSSSSSTKSEPLLEKMVYDGSGNASQVKSNTAITYGTQISYEDAKKIDGAIERHHIGHERDYTYWKGKRNGADVVYVLPRGNTAKPYNYSGEGIYQNIPDDSRGNYDSDELHDGL